MGTAATLGHVPLPIKAHIASLLEDPREFRCMSKLGKEASEAYMVSVFDQIKAYHAPFLIDGEDFIILSILHEVETMGSPTEAEKVTQGQRNLRKSVGGDS